MKYFVFLLIFIASVTKAQSSRATENVIPFVKAKPVPADIRKLMPSGGKSLRYGTDNNSGIQLHLYKLKGIGFLDLFKRTGKPRQQKLVRLNSFRLNVEQDVDPTTGTFSTHWLDPQHGIPIIRSVANGSGGFGGLWFLYVFSKGFKSQPVKQTFDFTFGINGYYRDVSFTRRNKDSFLVVRQFDGIVMSSDMTPEQVAENKKQDKETLFHWTGSQFKALEQ